MPTPPPATAIAIALEVTLPPNIDEVNMLYYKITEILDIKYNIFN